jgi:hypothetical protein
MSNGHYKVRWESNSRVKHFAAIGIIDPETIIPKTTTASFPMDCATVRMQQMQRDIPFITIHFKGSVKKAGSSNHWSYIPTMRINFGGGDGSMYADHNTCTFNGDLDLDAWPIDAVDAVVSAVKGAFEAEGVEMETTGGLYKAMTAGHTDGCGYDD